MIVAPLAPKWYGKGMDGISTSHDDDFYAWAIDQASVLRRLAATRRDLPNELDLENIAEEMEGLARTDLHEAESYFRLVLVHLIKIASSPQAASLTHWRTETYVFQAGFDTLATRTILRKIRDGKVWRLALSQAGDQLAERGDAILPDLPAACPIMPDDLVGDPFDIDAAVARIRAAAAPSQPAL